jgi:acetolactate synthase-1/2/3 large subunit
MDLAIVVGSKLGDKTTNESRLFSKGMRIVRIDSNSDEIGRNFDNEIPLVGDARETLEKLLTHDLPNFRNTNTLRQIRMARKEITNKYKRYESPDCAVSPSVLIREINNRYAGNAIICADASSSSGWVGALGLSRGNNRNIITPRGTGSLGFGFPATLAAKIARPDSPVFGIGGDTGFAMSVHEIETACRYNLDVHYFILDNGAMGLLEKHLDAKGSKGVLDKRHSTNWKMVAEGFGAHSATLYKNSDVPKYFDNLPQGPAIIQVMVNKEIDAPDFETIRNLSRSSKNRTYRL